MIAELAVIVLNYRTPDMTIDCLASMDGEIEPGFRVVVVDNASGDGSAERLERAVVERGWSTWAAVLRSGVNGGFAAGNNLGIRSVDASAYLLLNSDTLVRPGALRELRDAMRVRPEAGIIGAGLLTAQGTPDQSFFRVTGPASELVRAAGTGPITRLLRRFDPILPPTEQPIEPGWVGFACVLIRREVLDAVGLLDHDYFMYFEDIDYCRRARQAGWKILYWPRAKVVHLLGGSSQVSSPADQRSRAPRYYYEARARYFAKFYGRHGLWLANALWHVGRLVAFPRELLGRSASSREGEAVGIWTNALDPLRPREGGPA
ncbi:MAG TPA: glycosyltransferase family 2 protein [Thermoleophilia bacterium]|nr:glycosyltransferase family 2 protein [Thermoleophilia bacterium]